MTGPDDRGKRYLLWAQITGGLALIAISGFLLWIDSGSRDFDLSTDKLGILLVAGCALLGVALKGGSKP
jgi:cytochrome b subunit of formate dehydrogenase